MAHIQICTFVGDLKNPPQVPFFFLSYQHTSNIHKQSYPQSLFTVFPLINPQSPNFPPASPQKINLYTTLLQTLLASTILCSLQGSLPTQLKLSSSLFITHLYIAFNLHKDICNAYVRGQLRKLNLHTFELRSRSRYVLPSLVLIEPL